MFLRKLDITEANLTVGERELLAVAAANTATNNNIVASSSPGNRTGINSSPGENGVGVVASAAGSLLAPTYAITNESDTWRVNLLAWRKNALDGDKEDPALSSKSVGKSDAACVVM